MRIAKTLILSALLGVTAMGNAGIIANAAQPVVQNGQSYVTNWSEYEYDSPNFDLSGYAPLKDYRGQNPTFGRNQDGNWVSDPLIVKGFGIDAVTLFKYDFNKSNVKIYDYNTKKEINKGSLRAGDRVYIVSPEDPMDLKMKITPIFYAEN